MLISKYRSAPDDIKKRVNSLQFEDRPFNGKEGVDFRALIGTDTENKIMAHDVALPTLLNTFKSTLMIRRPDSDNSNFVNLYVMAVLKNGSIYCRGSNAWEEYNQVIPSVKSFSDRIIPFELFQGSIDLTQLKDTILYVGAAKDESELLAKKLYYPVFVLSNDCKWD